MILQSLSDNVRRVSQFSGRSAPALFWPYAICVVVIAMASIALVMIPELLRSFGKAQAFAEAHPDKVTITSSPGHYSIQIHENIPGLMPDMTSLAYSMGVVIALAAIFLAAAVARRLHDRGKSGWWGIMPLPFALFSTFAMPGVFRSVEAGQPDMGAFFAVFLSNAAYLAGLVFLVVLLLGKSDPVANRYGAGATQ